MVYDLLEKLNFFSKQDPDGICFVDSVHSSALSFSELDKLSGKVYHFLKKQGLGKEDFVLVCLPRSYDAAAAVIGVLKNDSAFVIVEDNYAPERITYIKENCECKLTIDCNIWEQIMKLEPLPGFEAADEHDAAFAYYTSGSTGKPKGILHERGNIGRIIESHYFQSCPPFSDADDRFALITPFNFSAAVDFLFYNLYVGAEIFIVPTEIVRNKENLLSYMKEHQISSFFMTPSYFRKFPEFPKSVRACIIGAEPVSNAYRNGVAVHNSYSLSESGYSIAHFLIDKNYKHTPVGKSDYGYKVQIIKENGEEAKINEIGEVRFENPFVRGYIKLDDVNQKCFQNGLFCSGDLGKIDENGNLLICGRSTEMVKINGNRVEPAEIEATFKKLTGLDWIVAKGFEDENKSYVCLYYLTDQVLDLKNIVEQMKNYLPKYMIPKYMIRLEEPPLNSNGKLSHASLFSPYDNVYDPSDIYQTI